MEARRGQESRRGKMEGERCRHTKKTAQGEICINPKRHHMRCKVTSRVWHLFEVHVFVDAW